MSDDTTLDADAHFAIVPEWVLYHDKLSDRAVRLYAILRRKADNATGVAWPSRATLAAALRGCSKESVDRAVKELVTAGAVTTERRFDHERKQWQSTRYTVMTSSPVTTGSRVGAPTPSRVGDDGVAAPVTTDLEPVTDSQEPTPPSTTRGVANAVSITNLCNLLATSIDAHRLGTGRPKITKAWERDMRLLIERGPLGVEPVRGVAPDVIARAITFVFEHLADPGRDGFCWADQVQSPNALRRHWPKLVDAKRKQEAGAGVSKGARTIDRVAERLAAQQRPALELLAGGSTQTQGG